MQRPTILIILFLCLVGTEFVGLYFYTKHLWETCYTIVLTPEHPERSYTHYAKFYLYEHYEQADVFVESVSDGWEVDCLGVFPTTKWMEENAHGWIGRGDVICKNPLTIRHDNKLLEHYGPETFYYFHLFMRKVDDNARPISETRLRIGPPGFNQKRSPYQIIADLLRKLGR